MRTAVFRKSDIDCVHEDKRFPRDFEVILTYRVGNFSLDPSESRNFERAADVEENSLSATLKTIARERPVGETCFFDPAIDNSLFPNVSAKVRMARSEMLSCSPASGPDGIAIVGNGPSDINDEGGEGNGGSCSGATYEKTGWLTKQGEKVRSWKKRWFVLRNGTVFYYGSPKSKTPKGVIPLYNVMAVVATTQPMDSTHVHCFELVVSTSSSSSSSSSSSQSAAVTAAGMTPSVLGGNGNSGNFMMTSPTSLTPSDKMGSSDKFSIRSYYICAESEEEKMDWVNSIKLAKGEDEN